MARNIGPELMADLERARPNMDPATYATRKLELEELIRKSKAIELSPLDRVGQVLLAGVGVLAIVYIGPNNFLVALFIALAAWWFAARWGRPLW